MRVDDDGDCLSIAGEGELVRDRATITALWSAAAKNRFPAGADDPNLVALRIRPASIEFWDAPSGKMRRLVAMARAAATGTRADIGEHGHVSPPRRAVRGIGAVLDPAQGSPWRGVMPWRPHRCEEGSEC